MRTKKQIVKQTTNLNEGVINKLPFFSTGKQIPFCSQINQLKRQKQAESPRQISPKLVPGPAWFLLKKPQGAVWESRFSVFGL